ncbi:MAG TPA: hypothetical protein VFJ58_20925 [Armatimonadota bacterium]|nr:hypothetical protein [Armatimonadota bacterium]
MSGTWGSFEIRGTLAATPAGSVYRASYLPTGQSARLYALQPGSAASAEEFYRRRQLAAVIGRHPRAWAWLESGAYDGTEYYGVAEPGGETLASYLGLTSEVSIDDLPGETLVRSPAGLRSGRASAWRIRAWMSDLASVVAYAHEHGLVIGCLSPYNIWICPDGSAMLMDAAGKTLAEEPAPDDAAAYLAPEQLMGRSVGPAADIYALGALLYWMLGGAFPAARRHDAARIGRYLPLPPLEPGLDPSLRSICETATALRPSARFRTAELLRAALLQTPDDLAAANARVSHAARSTLIRGFMVGETDLPVAVSTARPTVRILRWLQDLLFE